jgi:hypothetical protein
MRIYCDTCLYIDIFEGRKDRFRDLAEFALQIFRRVREGEFTLIVSDWLLFELSRHADDKTITDFLKPLFDKGKVIKVFKTPEDIKQAKIISPGHYHDALHAILANKAEAVYLLTRNIEHYAGCEHLVEIKFPENI